MMTVFLFKRVGTLQILSYGNHDICMLRVYLIIYSIYLSGYQNIIYSE